MRGDMYYEIWHPPPPQSVTYNVETGGGGCDQRHNNSLNKNSVAPSYGRMVDF